MPHPKITVAVPTFNRSGLLKETLASILAQDFRDFGVVVFDNASSDDTAEVIRSFDDPRVSHDRSPVNLGLLGNWNRCIQSNRSAFLCICHDDDLLLDGFLTAAHAMLTAHPKMGFCYARAKIIDATGQPRGNQPPEPGVEEGEMPGTEFLKRVVAGRPCTIFPSGVLYRAAALAEVGGYDSPHSKGNIDRNLFYRLASRFPVGHLAQELFAMREHPGQLTESHFRAAGGAGMLGAIAERMDAIAYLMKSPEAAAPAYRRWLAGRLLMLHRRESDEVHGLVPNLYWSWREQIEMAKRELDTTIPGGAGFVLVDEDQWGLGHEFQGRRVWPFIERDGLYWGPPADEQTAVAELERLRLAGAEYIAFAWTSFWWLDHYAELSRCLGGQPCVLRSPRLLVYRLPEARVRVRVTFERVKGNGKLPRNRTLRKARPGRRSTPARPARNQTR